MSRREEYKQPSILTNVHDDNISRKLLTFPSLPPSISYLPLSFVPSESYPLTPLPDEVGGGVITEGPSLLLATWTPKGHGLITVKDYDIYYRPAPRSSTGYRVTDSGIPGTIHNGVPDWLYEG